LFWFGFLHTLQLTVLVLRLSAEIDKAFLASRFLRCSHLVASETRKGYLQADFDWRKPFSDFNPPARRPCHYRAK
jgi:hypothetical protein